MDDPEARPSPPYPHPDSALLRVVVHRAVELLETGKTDARGAILWAAVHGWYEGTSRARTPVPAAPRGLGIDPDEPFGPGSLN